MPTARSASLPATTTIWKTFGITSIRVTILSSRPSKHFVSESTLCSTHSHIRLEVIMNRRGFLGTVSFGMAAFTTPGLFAQQLKETATTTEGPFYPDKMPLDTDNDLLILNDGITPAVGQITHLEGRVLTA